MAHWSKSKFKIRCRGPLNMQSTKNCKEYEDKHYFHRTSRATNVGSEKRFRNMDEGGIKNRKNNVEQKRINKIFEDKVLYQQNLNSVVL